MFISRIKIQNIKGKKSWENVFDGLYSNKVNLFVAPNGFGKSTLTTAFIAAAHGNMKLNKDDYYEQKESNNPCLEITYKDDSGNVKTVITDEQNGNVSQAFTIYVINNPVYAKSTSRNLGGFNSNTAKLYIKAIEVADKPESCKVEYCIKEIKRFFGRNILNLKEFFKSEEGLRFICEHRDLIQKCIDQKRINNTLAVVNSSNISQSLDSLRKHKAIVELMDSLKVKFSLTEKEQVEYLLQIIRIVKNNSFDNIKKALEYVSFKNLQERLDVNLEKFNTTGQELKATIKRNKLRIEFGSANRMSNGERDVLSFVANLIAFSTKVKNKPSILVIDEVFDYLDGANLLAVQFYLSRLIKYLKDEGRTVIPIIMTHLDPDVFSTYCFKKMAIHYLTNSSKINMDDDLVKLFQLRTVLKERNDNNVYDLEKYLLHYHPDNWELSNSLKQSLPNEFYPDSKSFRDYLYNSVEKYLHDGNYNALAIILGLRIKVEERTLALIPDDKKEGYLEAKGANNKLAYAESCACEIPELYYLLQSLYNESIHLSNKEKENRNKIESAYLKLSSNIVKEMIRDVFK